MDITLTAFNETFQAPWVGKLELRDAGKWIDDFMVLVSDRKHTDARTDVGTHTNLRLPSMLMMTLLPIVVVDEVAFVPLHVAVQAHARTTWFAT